MFFSPTFSEYKILTDPNICGKNDRWDLTNLANFNVFRWRDFEICSNTGERKSIRYVRISVNLDIIKFLKFSSAMKKEIFKPGRKNNMLIYSTMADDKFVRTSVWGKES